MGDRFFETVLAAHRRTADAAGVNWKAALYQEMGQEMKRKRLAMERMCVLTGVSRRGFYRFRPEVGTAKRDLELRDAIQRIALEMPSYGRPRITAELRRRGWKINPKRVRRIMREDNLLCLRHRKYLVTTDSRHRFAVYPNLAGGLQSALDLGSHLHPAGDRVCVSGCHSGCLLTSCDRLGSGSYARIKAHGFRAQDGTLGALHRPRPGASF